MNAIDSFTLGVPNMHDYITPIIALIGAIMGIFLITSLLKSRLVGNKHIQIIEQLSLGSKERVFLLNVNQDMILLSVTPHGISTLHVCSEPACLKWSNCPRIPTI